MLGVNAGCHDAGNRGYRHMGQTPHRFCIVWPLVIFFFHLSFLFYISSSATNANTGFHDAGIRGYRDVGQ